MSDFRKMKIKVIDPDYRVKVGAEDIPKEALKLGYMRDYASSKPSPKRCYAYLHDDGTFHFNDDKDLFRDSDYPEVSIEDLKRFSSLSKKPQKCRTPSTLVTEFSGLLYEGGS